MKKRVKLDWLDLRSMIAIGLCIIAAHYIGYIQGVTASIAVLLCTQETKQMSWKTGIIRMVITLIGGLVGIGVVLIQMWNGNIWVSMGLVVLGIGGTLISCKAVKVPYISARIGSITFLLVVMTRVGYERINYATFRLVSTVFGVLVVYVVAWVFDKTQGKRAMIKSKEA